MNLSFVERVRSGETIVQEVKLMKIKNTTALAVAGLGTVVSGASLLIRNRKMRSAVLGFGLAHVVLGGLDMLRPTTKD